MHSTPGEFLVGFLLTTTLLGIIFIVIKKLAKSIAPEIKKVTKYVIVFYLLAVLGSAIGSYSMIWNKPQSFQQGLRLLENSPQVISKIGEIYGYSFRDPDISSNDDNPVRLILTLNGYKGDMYVDVLLTKDLESNKWYILEFKKNSLIQDN